MAHIIPNGRAGYIPGTVLAAFFFIFPFSVFGQVQTCNASGIGLTAHSEGLAEQVADITVSCGGGAAVANAFFIVTLNANITNRLDANGNPTGITLTGAGVTSQPPQFETPKSLVFPVVQLPAGPTAFIISGIRAAVPTVSGGGATPAVIASVFGSQVNVTATQIQVAQGFPSLLSSVLNYGVPCAGSPSTPLPATVDFNALIAAGTVSSTVRITEASVNAFAPKQPTADFGVRFLVNISGYGPNAQVYVPDVIVGNLPASPTSAGAFNLAPNGGTYTANNNQLLLTRVNGADPTGAGGALFLAAPPIAKSFSSVTQLNLVNGAGYVVYEVLAANPGVIDTAQIPVFVVVPPTTCPDSLKNSLGCHARAGVQRFGCHARRTRYRAILPLRRLPTVP